MIEFITVILAAFGIGLSSSIHPCPMTTHIALYSLLCSWSQNGIQRLKYISLFLLTYIVTLVCIGLLIGYSVLAFDDLARTVQLLTKRLLGPVLMLVALVQTGLIPWRKSDFADKWKRLRSHKASPVTAMLMGCVFAVAFCPATAALFFGVLLPLAISKDQVVVCACAYGLGVLLPLMVVVLLTLKSAFVLDVHAGQARVWSRRFSLGAGSVLLIIGIYLSLRDIYVY